MTPPCTPVWLAGALASRAMQRAMRFADDPPSSEAAAEALAADCGGEPADDRAFDGVGGWTGSPCGCVLMQHGGGELAECTDGFAGSEDITEETRGSRTGVLEDLRKEIEGRSADAVERDISGEEPFDVGAADVLGIGAERGESLEVVGGEVGEGMCEGAEVVG